MAARILLAKPWSVLVANDIDIKRILHKVEYRGVYYGCWS